MKKLIQNLRVCLDRKRLNSLRQTIFFVIVFFIATFQTIAASPQVEKAVFAGGCFWCEETAFEGKPGVISVISGYAGGTKVNPTYEEVSAGKTGHAESVEVTYDPTKTSYAELLKIFWVNVDPTDAGGQFCDRGNQYRSEIFYMNETQKQLAEKSKKEAAQKLGQPIVTQITPLKAFYPAEEYHQDFYKKSKLRYVTYRNGCGRDRRLQELWGPSAESSH
jgi:peptide-methionine (S)-S-oxide reductase